MTTTPDPVAALAAHAADVRCDLDAQRRRWDAGFTRRTFLKGAGMAGVAALGSQLVTTRAAFAAPGKSNGNTVINVFLRGAADGLRMLVPASSALGLDHLLDARPGLVPGESGRIALSGAGGWAMNANLAPLAPFWASRELAFVPAVSSRGITRSHFDAQRFIDMGGVPNGSSGWMDRMLTVLGPGTTFRAIGEGSTAPASYTGAERKLIMSSLSGYTFPSASGDEARTGDAITALYRGMSGSLPSVVGETLTSLSAAAPLRGAKPQNGAKYPGGGFSTALADVARMLHAEVGVQVVALDVGGWDTHTAETKTLDPLLSSLATALAAFMTDLGPARRSRVTVVVTTEFGRRVAQNASGGTDHGHGSVMMLLGGGLLASKVAGAWQRLTPAVLDQGDVPGLNDPFQVYAEMVKKRLGATGVGTMFPGLSYAPLGLFRST